MPLEIRELVIRVQVDEKPHTADTAQISRETIREIIEECTNQVIATLDRRDER